MRLYFFVISSVLLHLMLYWLSDEIASHFETLPTQSEVEVEFLDEEDSRQFKVIKDFDMPEPDFTDPSNTNLLSARTLRFKEETRAAKQGPIENRAQKKVEQSQADLMKKIEAINKLSSEVIQQIKNENVEKARVAKRQQQDAPSPFQAKQGISTFYDPNSNAKIGDITVLNTNRYLFYTFFERIQNKFIPYYSSSYREITTSRPNVKRKDRDRTVWTTEFEVVLNPKGEFVRADIFRSSGLKEFDLAILDAFRKAAPFNNPPEELIDEDQKISLRFIFNTFWDPNDTFQVTN